MAEKTAPFAAFEWMIAWRYVRARRAEGNLHRVVRDLVHDDLARKYLHGSVLAVRAVKQWEEDVDVTDGAHGFWDWMTAAVHLKLDQPRRTRQDCDAQVPCLNRVPTVVAKDVGKRVRGHRNPLPVGRDTDGEGLPLLFVNSAEDATGSCTGNLVFP